MKSFLDYNLGHCKFADILLAINNNWTKICVYVQIKLIIMLHNFVKPNGAM